MKVLTGDYRDWVPPEGGAAVTVGVYDGVHRGHQHVLANLARRAQELGGLPLTVATFDRHPLSLVAPDRAPRLLTTVEQRLELFAEHGVEVAAIIRFDDGLRGLDPEDFAADVLVAALGATVVAVGADFRFGRDRAGNIEVLRDIGLGLGFYVEEIGLIGNGAPLKSTTVRSALAEGDVGRAAEVLGRPFQLRGTVVMGAQRGRTIGFPTANLSPPPDVMTPGHGVYAVRVDVAGSEVPGVVNVGVRPTFDGTVEVVEVHLLDFDGDLYGAQLDVAFLGRIRGEQKFDGIEELAAQIGRDVESARSMLVTD